jgi:hypothetical protein
VQRTPRALFLFVVGGLVASAWFVRPAPAAVIAGQVDNFEDGSLRNWSGGTNNPNAPVNIATGGPGGVNDNYLRLSSNGGTSAGGKLVAFNPGAQWSGDYITAGVDSIQMQVSNQGNTALTLRLIFVSTLGQTLGTVAAVSVPAGSGWTTASFPLTPGNLTGGTFGSVMSSVAELNLVHSPTAITTRSSSPNIVAQLGVDNVSAVGVPEPAAAALADAGAVLSIGGAGRRGRG